MAENKALLQLINLKVVQIASKRSYDSEIPHDYKKLVEFQQFGVFLRFIRSINDQAIYIDGKCLF